MAGLKKQLKDFKTIENSIDGNEYVFVSQNGNTRKTTINDVKKFTIGTEDMGTSATTIKGAIKEINKNINGLNIKNKFLFDDILGICGHRENYCKNNFAEYGFKYYRTDFGWDWIEKERGVYDYSICDKVIQNLEAQNVIPFIILDYNNVLYADNQTSAILTEANLLAFKNFVSNLVNRYKNKNIYYEIWNEPDYAGRWSPHTDSEKTYTNLVKEIYPVIKENDPTSTVCSPALTTRHDTTWFENACKCGLLNYTDKISLHLYTNEMPENIYQLYISKYKNIIYRYSKRNIPLIFSEFGYTTVPNWDGKGDDTVCTEEVRKDYIVRGILLGIMNQMDKMFVYEYRAKQTTNANKEDWFGIVNSDYSPTSTAIAIKNLASELKGYYYIGNFSNSINDYIAGFTNGSEIKYVYWTTSNEHSNFELGISLNLTSSPQIIEFNKNIYLNYNDYKENYFENKLIEIDSKKISGRNYAHSNRYWHTRDESGTFGINYEDEITKITKLVDNNGKHIYLPLVKTLDIGQYTVSFDIKNSQNTKVEINFYNIASSQNKGYIINDVTPSNEWLHFEKIIEIKTEDVNAIYFSSTIMALNQFFEIKNVKIEKGSRATAYELAHEEFALKSDLDSFIENLTTEQLTTLKAKLDSLP